MNLLVFNLVMDTDHPVLGFASAWVRALSKRVDSVQVVTMQKGKLESLPNVEVHSVGKERGFGEPRRLLNFYRVQRQVLRSHQIDMCFSHMMPLFTVLGATSLKKRRIPIVTWYAHPSLTQRLRLAHHLSDSMVTSLPTAYPYRRDEKLKPIGQGIDTDLFSPDGPVKFQDVPLILCVGRISRSKRLETLIEAAALLKDKAIQFKVALVGRAVNDEDARYRGELIALVDGAQLGDVVSFEESMPNDQLPIWYRSSTAHVNLTPVGFGDKVALEAMSCGRPSLVANEGFSDTLGPYRDALLFKCGDPEDLADRLEHLLARPTDERRVMGLNLRGRVVEMHSLTGLVERILELGRFHTRIV